MRIPGAGDTVPKHVLVNCQQVSGSLSSFVMVTRATTPWVTQSRSKRIMGAAVGAAPSEWESWKTGSQMHYSTCGKTDVMVLVVIFQGSTASLGLLADKRNAIEERKNQRLFPQWRWCHASVQWRWLSGLADLPWMTLIKLSKYQGLNSVQKLPFLNHKNGWRLWCVLKT